MPEIECREGLDPALIDDLMALIAGAWWAGDRTREDVELMLSGSDAVVSAVGPGGRLEGFARAISDGVYYAKVFDVIVSPGMRDSGVGAELMRRLHSHPALAGCRQIELACLEDLVPFYERLGYERADPAHLRLVRRLPDPG